MPHATAADLLANMQDQMAATAKLDSNSSRTTEEEASRWAKVGQDIANSERTSSEGLTLTALLDKAPEWGGLADSFRFVKQTQPESREKEGSAPASLYEELYGQLAPAFTNPSFYASEPSDKKALAYIAYPTLVPQLLAIKGLIPEEDVAPAVTWMSGIASKADRAIRRQLEGKMSTVSQEAIEAVSIMDSLALASTMQSLAKLIMDAAGIAAANENSEKRTNYLSAQTSRLAPLLMGSPADDVSRWFTSGYGAKLRSVSKDAQLSDNWIAKGLGYGLPLASSLLATTMTGGWSNAAEIAADLALDKADLLTDKPKSSGFENMSASEIAAALQDKGISLSSEQVERLRDKLKTTSKRPLTIADIIDFTATSVTTIPSAARPMTGDASAEFANELYALMGSARLLPAASLRTGSDFSLDQIPGLLTGGPSSLPGVPFASVVQTYVSSYPYLSRLLTLASEDFGVTPTIPGVVRLILALCSMETPNFDVHSVNPSSGATGFLQMLPSTLKLIANSPSYESIAKAINPLIRSSDATTVRAQTWAACAMLEEVLSALKTRKVPTYIALTSLDPAAKRLMALRHYYHLGWTKDPTREMLTKANLPPQLLVNGGLTSLTMFLT